MQERQIKATFMQGSQKVFVKNIICHKLPLKNTMRMEEYKESGLDESLRVRGLLCWQGKRRAGGSAV